MAKYRLFVGCSFAEDNINLRNYVRQQVEAHGSFDPIFGDEPHVTSGPAGKVRDLISSCHAAMIIEVPDNEGKATPWIYSEIGMAYQQRLPIFALVDAAVMDTGITKYAVSYESFDRERFTESRSAIWKGLIQLESAVQRMDTDIRSPENALKRFLAEVLPEMAITLQDGRSVDPEMMSSLLQDLEKLLDEAFASHRPYSDSDPFAEKLFEARRSKQKIADFVYDKFLKELDRSDKEVVLDSGTVTFTICEKLVSETCKVPIVTNNIALGRYVSVIPTESRILFGYSRHKEDCFQKAATRLDLRRMRRKAWRARASSSQ